MNSCPRIHKQLNRRYQRGLNLIEVMVSLVIGLFLVIGATTLYVRSKKTSDVDDSIARVQETVRYALSILETDVRMANYWGLQKDSSNISNRLSNLPNLASTLTTGTAADNCGANYPLDVENYVTGTNNSYSLACAADSGAIASSDTLTIRRATNNTAAVDGAKLQLCSTHQQSTIIRDGTATCDNGGIHDLLVNVYYIDRGSDQSSNYPSLRRKTLISGPAFNDQEIIPGIEDMQVQFGWANANSATAVEYLQPGTTLTNGQIVAVRVWLLARAETPDFGYTDTNTYQYGDRSTANGTATDLDASGAANFAYAPADNFRRLLVSRTFFIRNVSGT